LLLNIASGVFLESDSRGTHEHYLLVIYIYIWRERERERRELGVVVRDTTLGVGSRKQYILFRRFTGSAR
jgi:hypothetical protein